jgi:hypothetical protein
MTNYQEEMAFVEQALASEQVSRSTESRNPCSP